MASFESAIEAQLSGRTVRAVPLVHFEFLSGDQRLWPGFGTLAAGGYGWTGIGDLGSISGVSTGLGLAVEEMTFTLAGSGDILRGLKADAAEATGREVNVYLQFFDETSAPLDNPWQIFWGRMGPLKAERSDESRTITVVASNALLNRARASFGFFSHRDQQARHPGDNIYVRASQMADAKVRWPHF